MRYIIIAGLLIATALCSRAQTTIRTDTVVVQTITFESTDVTGKSKLLNAPRKNSVGMGIVSWANGYVPIYYERHLFDFMSIKVGVGLTFRSFFNDLGQLIWNDGGKSSNFDENDYFYSSPYTDVSESYNRYSYRKSAVGYYLCFAPKFYPRSDALDGFNLYPMLEFKQYNFRANQAIENFPVPYAASSDNDGSGYYDIPREKSFSFKETDRCLDFTINIGGHYQTSKVFFVEWRIGGGLRKQWGSRLDLGYLDLGGSSGGNYSYQYINATNTYTKLKPVFSTDLILGGVFGGGKAKAKK